MSRDAPLVVLWRRKLIVIVTFVLFVGATAFASTRLPPIYETDATLLIALPTDVQSFDAVQASQTIARSYAEILESPNFATIVAENLEEEVSPTDLDDAVTMEPLAETQLLEITVEDPSPERAKEIADTYARTFVKYADRLEQETTATVTVADPAPVPLEAARPQPLLYTVIAALLGLALGAALAYLRDRLDRRLRTVEDIQALSDHPVIGRIPRRGRSTTSINAFKEAHRILRTNLQFANGGRPLRSILVTSAGEKEGKTTTVTQLATTAAEVGERVIVVEADFRRPELQRRLVREQAPLQPGLSSYLVGQAPVESVIHPTESPNIELVPAGPPPPTPSALLEAAWSRDTVSELTGLAELVIVDSPPLSVGADASVVSRGVDGVLFVVDASSSSESTVRASLRQLDAVQAPVLGVVVNRDPSAEVSRYDYYGRPSRRQRRSLRRTARTPPLTRT